MESKFEEFQLIKPNPKPKWARAAATHDLRCKSRGFPFPEPYLLSPSLPSQDGANEFMKISQVIYWARTPIWIRNWDAAVAGLSCPRVAGCGKICK